MTIANTLTLCRLIMIPALVYSYLFWGGAMGGALSGRLVSAGILIMSGLTDVLDGFLARKRGEVTRLGTLLDPLADKLTVITALGLLVKDGSIPLCLAGILVVKELFLVLGAAVLAGRHRRIISARVAGKAATLFLFAGIVLLMLDVKAGLYAVYAGVTLSVLAGLDYAHIALALKVSGRNADNPK